MKMNIKPTKPVKKTSSPGETKKAKTIKPREDDAFTRMITSAVEGIGETYSVDDDEIGDLIELHQQFKATVNHEINNPLSVVQGLAQMMVDPKTADLSRRILKDVKEITAEISSFNDKDILAVGEECKRAPLEEITFRKDLVSCYLAKVIGPLTSVIRASLDDMEEALNIKTARNVPQEIRLNRVKQSIMIIKRQAERIRNIIDTLAELMPEDIEVSQYIKDLKMVNLKWEK